LPSRRRSATKIQLNFRQAVLKVNHHSTSHRDHDLAERLVRFEIAMGFDGLIEGERLGDDRLQGAAASPANMSTAATIGSPVS
jgi:hypothetical protein